MSTANATLLSERELTRWYGNVSPAETAHGKAEDAALEHLRTRFGVQSPDLRTAWLEEFDVLEGDAIFLYERRLLLLVGSLCLKNGQRALWTAIWAAVHAHDRVPPGEEFAFLEQATAEARAGKL